MNDGSTDLKKLNNDIKHF